MDELNAQIEDLEEQVQLLRNEKVKRKLFNHFDIQEEDLEGITNFRLQTSYTSWEAVHNEYATGKKGTIELTFTRNNKEVGFSMTFVRETPSFDGYDMSSFHKVLLLLCHVLPFFIYISAHTNPNFGSLTPLGLWMNLRKKYYSI